MYLTKKQILNKIHRLKKTNKPYCVALKAVMGDENDKSEENGKQIMIVPVLLDSQDQYDYTVRFCKVMIGKDDRELVPFSTEKLAYIDIIAQGRNTLATANRTGVRTNQRQLPQHDRGIWDAICRVERGKVSNKMRFSIYQRDGYRCRRCGASGRFSQLEVDHIIPIAKGGKSTYNNLQTLCHRCNVEKGDSLENY